MLTECDSASADCLRRRVKDVKCKCQSALTCCSPSSLFSLFCHCRACITIASHLRSRLIDNSCRASQCCSASGPTSAMGPDCPESGMCRKEQCQNDYGGYCDANCMIEEQYDPPVMAELIFPMLNKTNTKAPPHTILNSLLDNFVR